MTAGSAWAGNVTPDFIDGDGVANGSFTIGTGGGVELGLRGKLRFNASNDPENTFNWDGNKTYTFLNILPPTGFTFAPGSPTTPIWSFDWSINTDFDSASPTGKKLDDFQYVLKIDGSPTGLDTGGLPGQFDPINVPLADHAIGTNSTGNGGGTTATSNSVYVNLIANNNVAANSWSYEFFNGPTGLPQLANFDPTDVGTYTISLEAFDGSTLVASTSIDVNVVPEPMTAVLSMVGVGLLASRRTGRLMALMSRD